MKTSRSSRSEKPWNSREESRRGHKIRIRCSDFGDKTQWEKHQPRFRQVSATSSGLVFDAASSRPTIRDSGCESCPNFFKMEGDHERIVDVTTPNFNGIISMMDPRRSWAARWLRIGKFAPGCYTLAVSEALPEDMQFICQEERVRYVPPKHI